ncbi:uncharacterized protein PV06_11594 [Exophiala oligosperma]|uniref:Heterokaryon incompatibility domain-containing protein n=1 Tax=Exophiala oligosperma TaxID=215243 RepID=A0A0D2DK71_9EURO|nr:uncharacterized protein PV06_11594 [Exophiala oligosperma]KIW36119.1 hypothetical protein PV06_11594 [Exophiala oligosperma]
MMGTIYNQADRVVVWLGKDERGDGPGIARMITHLADAWNQYPMKDNWAKLPNFRTVDDLDNTDLLFEYGLPIWGTRGWIALGLFLNREWFHRLWCAQEIALARKPDDTRLQYGRTCVVWNDLISVSIFMSITGLCKVVQELLQNRVQDVSIQPGMIGEEASSLFLIASFLKPDVPPEWVTLLMTQLEQAPENLNGYNFLLLLLRILRKREASDERDKLLRLLGMVNHFCEVRGIEQVTVSPDYNRPPLLVLKDAAKDILMNTHGGLTFLSLGRSWSPMVDRPSWMIGFAGVEAAGRPLTEYLYYNVTPTYTTKEGVIRFRDDALQLSAHEVGTVEEVSLTGAEMASGKFSEYLHLVRKLPLPTRTGQPPTEVLWRVLIGDHDSYNKSADRASDSISEDFSRFIQYMLLREKLADIARQIPEMHYEVKLHLLDDLASNDKSGSICTSHQIKDLIKHHDIGIENVSDSERRILAIIPQNDRFIRDVQEMTSCRCLYRTVEGDLGLGPLSMRPGDRVWILRGARVPFVLRPATDVDKAHYHLLGETYVHGVMRGELLAQDSSLQWKDIGIV